MFPNFINGFEVSVPFMIAYVTEMFFCLLSPEAKIEVDKEIKTGNVDIFDLFNKNQQLKKEVHKKEDKFEENEDQIIEEKIMEKQ